MPDVDEKPHLGTAGPLAPRGMASLSYEFQGTWIVRLSCPTAARALSTLNRIDELMDTQGTHWLVRREGTHSLALRACFTRRLRLDEGVATRAAGLVGESVGREDGNRPCLGSARSCTYK